MTAWALADKDTPKETKPMGHVPKLRQIDNLVEQTLKKKVAGVGFDWFEPARPWRDRDRFDGRHAGEPCINYFPLATTPALTDFGIGQTDNGGGYARIVQFNDIYGTHELAGPAGPVKNPEGDGPAFLRTSVAPTRSTRSASRFSTTTRPTRTAACAMTARQGILAGRRGLRLPVVGERPATAWIPRRSSARRPTRMRGTCTTAELSPAFLKTSRTRAHSQLHRAVSGGRQGRPMRHFQKAGLPGRGCHRGSQISINVPMADTVIKQTVGDLSKPGADPCSWR